MASEKEKDKKQQEEDMMEKEKQATIPRVLIPKKERVKRTKAESIVIWSAFTLFVIYNNNTS